MSKFIDDADDMVWQQVTPAQREALDEAIANAHLMTPTQQENLFVLRMRTALRALPPDKRKAVLSQAWQAYLQECDPGTVN
ncbi:MAG: DUF3106 domain-containing protein [Thiobacillus sp.]